MDEIRLDKKIDFGALLGMTFKFFGRNFFSLIKVAGVFYLPSLLIALLLSSRYNELANMFSAAVSVQGEGLPGTMRNSLLLSGLSLLSALFVLAGKGALVKAIDTGIAGGEIRVGESVKASLSKFGRLLLATIVAAVMTGFGFVFCIVPGFILMIYLTFVIQTIILEEKPVFTSIGASFDYVKKNFWQIFLALLVLGLIYDVVFGAVATPLIGTYFWDNFVKSGINLLQSGAANPSTPSLIQPVNLYLYIFFSTLCSLLFEILVTAAMTIKYRSIRALRENPPAQVPQQN